MKKNINSQNLQVNIKINNTCLKGSLKRKFSIISLYKQLLILCLDLIFNFNVNAHFFVLFSQ